MVTLVILYILGAWATFVAVKNTTTRRGWPENYFGLTIAPFSWVSFISVLTANKHQFGKWWYV